MKLKKRAPQRVATSGALETICTLSKSGGSAFDSKPNRRLHARGWRIETHYRKRREEYFMNASNGVVFVGFFGKVGQSNALHSRIEAELRGALDALEWIKHEDRNTPCEIRFSTASFAILMGESPCPSLLKHLLDKVRRKYIESADSITIDRRRQALVSKEERLAA